MGSSHVERGQVFADKQELSEIETSCGLGSVLGQRRSRVTLLSAGDGWQPGLHPDVFVMVKA